VRWIPVSPNAVSGGLTTEQLYESATVLSRGAVNNATRDRVLALASIGVVGRQASSALSPQIPNWLGYAVHGTFFRAWKCLSNTVLSAHSPLKSNKCSSAISKYHIAS
jgi:hypothetical protein